MDYLEIAQIVNTHGLRGNVKANVFSEEVENIAKYNRLYIKTKEGFKKYTVEKMQFSKKQAIIKFLEIKTKEQAEEYKNKYIYIDKLDLEPLEQDAYYIVDLIGLEVFDEKTSNYIGTLESVEQTAPTDVYVIKRKNEKDLLLPAVSRYVKKVDINNKKMIVSLENYEI